MPLQNKIPWNVHVHGRQLVLENIMYASYHPSDTYTQTYYICINVTQDILINVIGTRYWDCIFVVTNASTTRIVHSP